MKSIKPIINEFDKILKQYNSSGYEKMNLPLSDNEIENNLAEFNLLNEDIKNIYSWRNGTSDIRYKIMKFGSFLPLTNIRSEIKSLYGIYDNVLKPFITDGEAYILFNTNKSESYGRLYLFSPSLLYVENPIIIYDSVLTMLETIIECYEKGAYVYDQYENWLNFENHKIRDIARTHNKNSPFWFDHDPLNESEWYRI